MAGHWEVGVGVLITHTGAGKSPHFGLFSLITSCSASGEHWGPAAHLRNPCPWEYSYKGGDTLRKRLRLLFRADSR